YVDDDFPAQLPIKLPAVGLVLTTGEPDFGLLADDDWGTQFPPSDGFTDLGPTNRTFLVSMVHQLHCLDVMRVGFVTNRTGYAHHVAHCLRYLRQAILCMADTTLEPSHPVVMNGEWTYAAGGVGSVHRCRDWMRVRQYLEEHPAQDPIDPRLV
ncbi:uncharacterized protein BXZ73DRAFT_41731, partial [Epithele typhae]|uniref:uncharacterized protein n=1 Tax=Epithele typhae TaxID=378194 RepID=UPI002008C563